MQHLFSWKISIQLIKLVQMLSNGKNVQTIVYESIFWILFILYLYLISTEDVYRKKSLTLYL